MKMANIYYPIDELEHGYLMDVMRAQIEHAKDIYQKQFLTRLMAKMEKAKTAWNDRKVKAAIGDKPAKKK